MERRRARALLALAAALAGACAAATPAAAAPSTPDGLCAWPVRDSADLVNVAFPDESAHYWGSIASGIPGTGIVIRGRYPKARYFSLHTYNLTLGAYDSLNDREIDPVSGVNRFRKPARGDGTWEIRILPGDAPADPPANTMYTGSSRGVPNLAAVVLYRVYVADDPRDPEGGVGLPEVGAFAGPGEIPFAGCSLTSALPETNINELIQELNYPDGLEIPSTNADDPPVWKKFFGFGQVIADLVGLDALGPVFAGALPSGGFLNNLDNDYMSAAISREYGGVVVMRAKMPTFPDTRAGEPPWRRSQLRYWSICQNHAITQRYVDCIADHEAVLDERRRGTFVISDPEDRPANANAGDGVNWLPWGGIYPSGQLIYRQMLASPRFKRALALVEQGEPLAPRLGPYLPRIAYCTTAAFESDGARGCLRG